MRTAFVDEQAIARGFSPGDLVRKTGTGDFLLSPYVGRVLYANPRTGTVQVQWPWGDGQEAPSELVKDLSGLATSAAVDTSYSTLEKTRYARIAAAYESRTLPLWRAACEAWHCEMPEVTAYVRMSGVFGQEFGQDAVRLTVANLYECSRRLAIYWNGGKRKYKVTKKEVDSGKLSCPRCRDLLRPRTYRAGQRVLMCTKCGFSIHPKDLRKKNPRPIPVDMDGDPAAAASCSPVGGLE